jgi:hypothetical protein
VAFAKGIVANDDHFAFDAQTIWLTLSSKIKCCGSEVCANCQRARRPCDYSPVPEEVNRATREKKAAAKAAKAAYAAQRATPYYVDQSIYSIPYLAGPGPIRGTHVPPRRAFSTPGMGSGPFGPYSPMTASAPPMSSPAGFEAPWFHAPPVPVISVSPMVPMVPTMPHSAGYTATPTLPTTATPTLPAEYIEDGNYTSYTATAPVSPTESSASTSYPMPVTPVRKPLLHTPPHTPQTVCFQAPPNLVAYTPQPFPFSPSPLAQSNFSTSPTLCPGLPVEQKQPQKPLVGLGIGLASEEHMYTSAISNEYLSVAPHSWSQDMQFA